MSTSGVFLGLAAIVVLGLGVGFIVRAVSRTLPMEAPSDELEPYWDKLRKMQTGGFWIGQVERPIFFSALLIPNGWPILTSWLLFKLAYYCHAEGLSKSQWLVVGRPKAYPRLRESTPGGAGRGFCSVCRRTPLIRKILATLTVL